ncbi:GyrI-like domain-containing protein [Clostridium sp. 'deep sea']|nr:effector binding domain-containing protein [Clostridium sp. 'deep sea']QOR37027.1 GyrI-like domain-containing protein [Clostridium sp. 'deep sea']
MNWLKALNNALNYLEDNILEKLNYDELAKIALCSKYHFLRTFTVLAGYPLGEYIRNRRLSLAAKDLITTNIKIIELAYKYGYETPEAFSKVFKRFHGISPSIARKKQGMLKTVLPLSFQLTIKGEERMDYKIVRKDSFKVVGLSKRVSMKNNKSYNTIPLFLQELVQSGNMDLITNNKIKSYGVGYDYDFEHELFSYLIAVDGENIEGLENAIVLNIPSCTWAVFKCVGAMPQGIQEVWKRIYAEWLPATKYEHALTPELEVYYAGNHYAEDYVSEIWIPVIERKH